MGALGFAIAAALPWILWHRAIVAVSSGFQLDPSYLSGWIPWVLIALGILFFVPVTLSAGRDPDSRWYPRARNAYAAWGITLYLCGCGLATQVAQITQGLSSP